MEQLSVDIRGLEVALLENSQAFCGAESHESNTKKIDEASSKKVDCNKGIIEIKSEIRRQSDNSSKELAPASAQSPSVSEGSYRYIFKLQLRVLEERSILVWKVYSFDCCDF